MTETATEKVVCSSCGAERRENTQFCYNCGKDLADAAAAESDIAAETSAAESPKIDTDAQKSALDDLAERLKASEESDESLAKAAAERKKSRSVQRKSKKVVWEPNDEVQNGLVLLMALIFGFLALVAVLVTVYWK